MFKLDMKKKKLSYKLETHSPNARHTHTTIEKKRDTGHSHVEAEKRAKKS